MYTGRLVKISWNGGYSNSFPIKNGAKQGAVVSPVLFRIDIDNLLCELESNGIGCFIGKMFVGARADDILLIASKSHTMRRILPICGSFCR